MFEGLRARFARDMADDVAERVNRTQSERVERMQASIDGELKALRQEIQEVRAQAVGGDAAVLRQVFDSAKRTMPGGNPIANPLAEIIRDVAILRWNAKVMGAELARALYARGQAGPMATVPSAPVRAGLQSKLCAQADIEAEWCRYWCGQLRMTPLYVRKLWEYGYVLQAIWEAGLLEPGRVGLGFAIGNEPTPSYFASRGISILATDLAGEDDRAAGWRATVWESVKKTRRFRSNGKCSSRSIERSCRALRTSRQTSLGPPAA